MENQTPQQLAAQLTKGILELDALEKKIKADKDAKKDELKALCNSVYNDFFTDETWEIPESSAVIKVALNPPKVIDTRSGKSILPADRRKIAMNVPDKYCVVDLNIKEIQNSVEFDSELKHIINNHHLQVIQETRYDVKKLK